MTTRNWVFTLNNPQPEEDPKTWLEKGVTYCVWQAERGENGTLHYQGYLQLDKKSRISALKKINPRAHWEPRRGTHEEALAYSTKEESRVDGPWTYGAAVTQGERTDLSAFLRAAVELPNEYQLATKYPNEWVKYYRAAERFRRLAFPPRSEKTSCLVLYGVPGTGKSSYCAKNHQDAYWKPKGEWWDGYANQEVVVIDEFYGWLPFDFMCRLLDRYPLMVPTKGGFLTFSSKLVVITSNKHPREWYDLGHVTWGALARRIDECWYYSGIDPPKQEDVNFPSPVLAPMPPIAVSLVRAGAVLNALRTDEVLSPESLFPTQPDSPEVVEATPESCCDSCL